MKGTENGIFLGIEILPLSKYYLNIQIKLLAKNAKSLNLDT